MANKGSSKPKDFVQRFILENLDIRGAIVRLGGSWRRMLHDRDYVPVVQKLLGETTAVVALIGANLKQTGRLTVQVRGHGKVRMMVVDCTDELGIRGMAIAEDDTAPAPLGELLGDGRLVLTVDLDAARQPYQSVVPLHGDTVAEMFEHFLEQSEQQPTRLWLFADGETAVGLFLQTLPGAAEKDEDGWNRAQHLAGTVRQSELVELLAEELLMRLFPEEVVRLFDAVPVTHNCPRDEEKVDNMLRSLGRAEVEANLSEHGEIVVKDDICNHVYRYDAEAVARLFDEASRPTLH